LALRDIGIFKEILTTEILAKLSSGVKIEIWSLAKPGRNIEN
jgi:hypothetical protein